VPLGEDTTVTKVVDGDTVEVAGPITVRLIGVDAPYSGGCFAADSTAHTGQLLPPGARVRLAYDVGRTDQLGRTLAYVYRLTDGLFVNVALARNG
jgi:micrococcal nuclease